MKGISHGWRWPPITDGAPRHMGDTGLAMHAQRIDDWILCEDAVLPVIKDMALEEIDEHHPARPFRSGTKVSYVDGRRFVTRTPMRALLRAMVNDDDAVTFDPIVGTPREQKDANQ